MAQALLDWIVATADEENITIDHSGVKKKIASDAGFNITLFERFDRFWKEPASFRCFGLRTPSQRERMCSRRARWLKTAAAAKKTAQVSSAATTNGAMNDDDADAGDDANNAVQGCGDNNIVCAAVEDTKNGDDIDVATENESDDDDEGKEAGAQPVSVMVSNPPVQPGAAPELWKNWTTKEVVAWIQSLGFVACVDEIQQGHIDGTELPFLNSVTDCALCIVPKSEAEREQEGIRLLDNVDELLQRTQNENMCAGGETEQF